MKNVKKFFVVLSLLSILSLGFGQAEARPMPPSGGPGYHQTHHAIQVHHPKKHHYVQHNYSRPVPPPPPEHHRSTGAMVTGGILGGVLGLIIGASL